MLYGQEDEEEAEVGQSITDAEAEDAARARADLELVAAAYPDEVQLPPELDRDDDGGATAERELKFPILFTLRFDPASTVQLEIPAGYPTRGPGLRVASYRSNSAESKLQMELAVSAIRKASLECLEDGVEAALACCAAGLESWREGGTADLLLSAEQPFTGREESTTASALHRNSLDADLIDNPTLSLGSRDHAEAVEWISGDPIVEKKSVFQAHVCRISREAQVLAALHHLLDGNSKLQRATHNMWAYRVRERVTKPSTGTESTVLKHDNDDDGEDAAGGRLAMLLDVRDEDGVLVVVSRWYGGIHLGPRRFAVIANVARELLDKVKAR